MSNRQKVHHLCLKIKHAAQAKHPRTFVRDTSMYRQILSILHREGFLSNVLPGDDRGPFVDILANARTHIQNMSTENAQDYIHSSLLQSHQQMRLKAVQMTRQKVMELHQLCDSDGSSTVSVQDIKNLDEIIKRIEAKDSDVEHPFFSTAALFKQLDMIPSVASVYVPDFNDMSRITVQDLAMLTVPPHSNLWVDLKYDDQNRAALSDMFMISKGSRKVFQTPNQIQSALHGKSRASWKGCNDLGSITIVKVEGSDKSSQPQFLTARDALKQKANAEIVCVAK
ncbi:hypothetical protein MP228_002591 [Amoeboaphelidium protococcarum]|nr:hypothetical protein MP228_002591 [Amoeboaphelidium protococcarum]